MIRERLGRYELLRPLGRGGMAELFLARYRGPAGFEKQLVIKRLPPRLAGDLRFVELFLREARTQVALSHGNLVQLFDFGRVGNDYFLAMEHVRGVDLGALLADAVAVGEPLPPAVVGWIGVEVCRGLAYMHRSGFVHRDVTPRNILVSSDGAIKLADFGVARAASSRTTLRVRGTFAYMAPEQAAGEVPDGRADLYALGLVLAEAVTGRPVRRQDRPQAAQRAAREAITVEIDGPLGAVVARATAPRREDRHASAEAMQLELEAVIARAGGSAMSSGRALAERAQRCAAVSEGSDPGTAMSGPGAITTTGPGEGAYFRDHLATAGFLDDVLTDASIRIATTRRRSGRRRWLLVSAGLSVMTIALLAVVGYPPRPRVLSGSAPEPSSEERRVAIPSPPPPASVRVVPQLTAGPPEPTAHTLEKGTVKVWCSPECRTAVDGRRFGRAYHRHRLTLTAGGHLVTALCGSALMQHTIEVKADREGEIEFNFQ